MKDTKTHLSRGLSAFKSEHATEQIFAENEVRANLLVGKFMLACAAGLALCWVLNMLGVLAIGKEYILYVFPIGIFLLLLPSVICLAFKGQKPWIKYLSMLSLILTFAYLDSILLYNVTLLIVIPVVFSCWYYSRHFTLRVSLLTTVFFALSAFCGAYFSADAPDMNFFESTRSAYIRAFMLQSFLPRWMMFVIIAGVCYVIAVRGRNMVLKQDAISKSNARVETELDMAGRIQTQALPAASALSVLPCRPFDLAAKMQPAREVGGDFYDFFYLDETHLALIVADVADKGIAAALYMMMSKLMLDNKLTVCRSPGQVLQEVNRQLHQKSLKGMFVTVWLGVYDLETGDLITANAGHEYPILKRGGRFELFRDKHGFVLGGVAEMKYTETRLHLDEGDVLFVYTDGVTEANAPDGTQFGETRLLDALNQSADGSMEDLVEAVESEISAFAADAPQFDDITMLALRRLAPTENKLTVKPELTALDDVQGFVSSAARKALLTDLQTKKLNICVDEIFSNIVKYSGASTASVSCDINETMLSVTFRDDGDPFDPLGEAAPDPQAPVPDRIRGGLGIFITKSYTDSAEYSRTDKGNVLTLTVRSGAKEEPQNET